MPRDPNSPAPPPSANIAKYAPDLLLIDMNEREIGFRGGVNPLIVCAGGAWVADALMVLTPETGES